MAINTNVTPYFDDFNPTKNYYSILFKPGFAVQARELNQMQTILQDQISKFASNIFSENTPITGGKVTTNLNVYYLKLQGTFSAQPVVASQFLNKIITDPTGAVLAKVLATQEAAGGDPPTLVVSYISGLQFTDNTVIKDVFSLLSAQLLAASSTGLSSVASISNGVFYIVNGWSVSSTPNPDGTFSKFQIGHFVTKNPETIILSKYSNSPSVRIGLTIVETIADVIADPSLLDPAVGASNYQAPGADRYQISINLSTQPLTAGSDQNFIELVRIQNGQIVKQVNGTVYGVIDDYFAKRDFETNGDYIVDDFALTPSANISNTSIYNMTIGKGLAYVRGYRIENQSDLQLQGNRARTTQTVNNNSVFLDYGNYFFVDTGNGVFDITQQPAVELHSVITSNIVTTNATTYNATLVGTARMRGLDYDHNTADANGKSYVYRADLYNIVTNTIAANVVSSTSNTITITDTNGTYSSVANAYFGGTLNVISGTDSGEIRKIVGYTVSGASRVFTVATPWTINPDSTSVVNIILDMPAVNSIVIANKGAAPYGLPSSFNVNIGSKVGGVSSATSILEDTNTPELVWLIGYPYVSSVSGGTYETSQVYRSQTIDATGTMVLTANTNLNFLGVGTLSPTVVKQNFTVVLTSPNDANNGTSGSIMDFSTTGNNVSISTNKQTATFTSSLYRNATVTVIAKQQCVNADDLTVALKSKNLILGNTTTVSTSGPSGIITGASGNTYVDLTNCQVYIQNGVFGTNTSFSLYTTDVKRIRQIIDTGSPSVVPTVAMLTQSQFDVTSQYFLDNGQRDGHYDHASINLVPGASSPKGNLLVIYDFYKHGGGDGYFSLMSYLSPVSSSPENYTQIPTFISKHGVNYALRNCLDFRPSRVNATSSFTFEFNNSSNPNIRIPINLTQFTSTYGFYLGRKDKLILSKDQSFKLLEGVPSTNPQFPTEPDGSMVLSELVHDPYTSFVPGEAPSGAATSLSVNKIQHRRWTMQDITGLQTRINNLEYYSSLSLLEQNAQSLQVPDVNGLNRFKNGILVDDFSSYGTADSSNPDFSMKIDSLKKRAGPIEVVTNIQLQNPLVTNSAGSYAGDTTLNIQSIAGTGSSIYTLPYTSANLVVQQLASSAISVNPFSVAIQQGVARLVPAIDNWVDSNQNPSLMITDPNLQFFQQNYGKNVVLAGDWKALPGTQYNIASSQQTVNRGTQSGSTTAFGSQVGFTQTSAQPYASQIQGVSSASGYNKVGSNITINNNFLTNVSVLPYIRPQQIIVRAKGMLVNTPVKTWFDGQQVDAFMKAPDIIRLTSVTGTFKENDIVGFIPVGTLGSSFQPVARVLYVQVIGSETRLYVAEMPGSTAYTFPGAATLQNATYDVNGNYAGSTASGILASGTNIFHFSGTISGVGGTYQVSGNSSNFTVYKMSNPSYCSFLNQYGVWGDKNVGGTSSTFNSPTFTVNFPTTDTYTFTYAVDNDVTINLDGSVIATLAGGDVASNYNTPHTYTATVTAGNHTIQWLATNIVNSPAAFGLRVTDSLGNETFATTNPPGLTYTGLNTEIPMPDGGSLFTGVTQIKLDPKANPTAAVYVGAKINITTKQIIAQPIITSTVVPPTSIATPSPITPPPNGSGSWTIGDAGSTYPSFGRAWYRGNPNAY